MSGSVWEEVEFTAVKLARQHLYRKVNEIEHTAKIQHSGGVMQCGREPRPDMAGDGLCISTAGRNVLYSACPPPPHTT